MRIKFDERKDRIKISTVKPQFLAWYGNYETAIMMPNSQWKVVRTYKTSQESVKGHIDLLNKSYEELDKMEQIDMID